MALIRVERVSGDDMLEAQEFRTQVLDIRIDEDGSATLHFVTEDGHPSLTVMLDPQADERDSIIKRLAA